MEDIQSSMLKVLRSMTKRLDDMEARISEKPAVPTPHGRKAIPHPRASA